MPKLFIDLGLPQGLLILSIFQLFYNRDLLDDCIKKRVNAQRYIDDIGLIAKGKFVKSNNENFAKVHNRVCEGLRMKHKSELSVPKYQLIHISRKRNIDYTPGVRLRRSHLVKEASTEVNLSITFESKLRQKDQIFKIRKKTVKNIGALLSIIWST